MAGTDDNILGGQDAVIRVGVEADMSEILQQATKFNELIKDANDSFNVMQTVINSTTTRMASLNSATLRLVSSARQLRNEYQLIADSSQRIGLLGDGGDVGGGPIGIGGGSLAGVTAPSGRSYVQNERGLLVPEGTSGIGGAVEIGELAPGIGAGLTAAGRAGAAVTGGLGQALDIFSEGAAYSSGTSRRKRGGGYVGKHRSADSSDSSYIGKHRADDDLDVSAPDPTRNLINQGAGPTTVALSLAGKVMGKIPGIGAALSSAGLAAYAPYALAAVGALVAVYKSIDYAIKGATKYTGMTGGTGVYTSPAEGNIYGINRGSFIGLQAQKWVSGLLNMAVGPGGYGEIQEGLLSAGYKPYGDEQANRMGMQGMRYDQARFTLAKLYAKGFQDVGTNIPLMAMSMESARSSTASFVSAMDALRVSAQRANVDLKKLSSAFGSVMKSLTTGLGATGNWTNLFASSYATAYENSRNSALRSGGAVADLSQFTSVVQLMNTPAFRQEGITFNNSLMAFSGAPGMARTLALGTDQAVDNLLKIIGIGSMRGRDPREVETILRNNSQAVQILRQSALAQGLVGPEVAGDVNAFLEWLTYNAVGDPVSTSLEESIKAAGANIIQDFTNTSEYFQGRLGNTQSQSRDKISKMLRSSRSREDYPVLSYYYDYVSRTNKSIGWLESLGVSGEQGQTYVDYRGEQMKLGKFLTEFGNSPEARRLIESGQLRVATSQDGKAPSLLDYSEAYNIGGTEKNLQDATLSEFENSMTRAMIAWAQENNTSGSHLKVDDGVL